MDTDNKAQNAQFQSVISEYFASLISLSIEIRSTGSLARGLITIF